MRPSASERSQRQRPKSAKRSAANRSSSIMTMEYRIGHYFKRITMIDTLLRCRPSSAPKSLSYDAV